MGDPSDDAAFDLQDCKIANYLKNQCRLDSLKESQKDSVKNLEESKKAEDLSVANLKTYNQTATKELQIQNAEVLQSKNMYKETWKLKKRLIDQEFTLKVEATKKKANLSRIELICSQLKLGRENLESDFDAEILRRRGLLLDRRILMAKNLEDIETKIHRQTSNQTKLVQKFESLRTEIAAAESDRYDMVIQKECKEEELLLEEIKISGNSYMDNITDLLDFLEKDTEEYPEPPSPSSDDHVNSLLAMKGFVKTLRANKYKFKTVPRGPLFSYISVTNMVWAPLLEKLLSDVLFAFLVDSIEDEELMRNLIEKAYGKEVTFCNHPIRRPKIINLSTLDNLEGVKPAAINCDGVPAVNMMDVMEVRDDDFFFAITILTDSQKTFFFDSEHKAYLAMSSAVAKEETIIGYTIDGYEVFPFPCFKTVKLKSMNNRALYLKPVANQQLIWQQELLQSEVSSISSRIQDCNNTIKNLRKLQLESVCEIECDTKNLNEMKKQKSHLESKINAIDNRLSSNVTMEAEVARFEKYEQIREKLVQEVSILSEKLKKKMVEIHLVCSGYKLEKKQFKEKLSFYHTSRFKYSCQQNEMKKTCEILKLNVIKNTKIVQAIVNEISNINALLASQSADITLTDLVSNEENHDQNNTNQVNSSAGERKTPLLRSPRLEIEERLTKLETSILTSTKNNKLFL